MSRTPSRRGLSVATLLAGTFLAVGLVFALDPTVATGAVPALEAVLASLDPGLIVLVATLLLVVFAPALGIAGKLRSRPVDPLVGSGERTAADRPDGEANARSRSPGRRGWDVVGDSFERDVERATDYDGDREVRSAAREEVVDTLRPIATRAYANRAGVARSAATRVIERGSWTDDDRAAAFLAGESGPSTPVWLWLFDLVTATDPFSRSLERTIDEIESIQAATTIDLADEEATSENGTDENDSSDGSRTDGDARADLEGTR
ncbi:DUF7269 family protein [Natrialba swarupiae]|uniref:Uncharacterized protein n=1 Tax=Natrialba swarupiae TaxID=2448032 RepID=A0A5D5ATH8_9EURY|nr:hypothetical protein [Natrialba swarupiae]TYT62331.1 hypothetical protein FYC77_08925 [Natrialba swarupiae]